METTDGEKEEDLIGELVDEVVYVMKEFEIDVEEAVEETIQQYRERDADTSTIRPPDAERATTS